MVYSVSIMGLTCSVLYIFLVPEVKLTKLSGFYNDKYQKKWKELDGNDDSSEPLLLEKSDETTESKPEKPKGKNPKDWLKDPSFYIHGGIYMMVRLAMNLTMTVIPFYLIEILKIPRPDKNGSSFWFALVPLISFIASSIFSLFFYKRMITFFGNRLKPLFVGCVIIAVGSFSFLFMGSSFLWLVLISVPIQGIGLAILLNTATSIISDVIGSDDSSSAFVYGVYSLFDKFSSGFCLYFMT